MYQLNELSELSHMDDLIDNGVTAASSGTTKAWPTVAKKGRLK
jgi:hypothetical protein